MIIDVMLFKTTMDNDDRKSSMFAVAYMIEYNIYVPTNYTCKYVWYTENPNVHRHTETNLAVNDHLR